MCTSRYRLPRQANRSALEDRPDVPLLHRTGGGGGGVGGLGPAGGGGAGGGVGGGKWSAWGGRVAAVRAEVWGRTRQPESRSERRRISSGGAWRSWMPPKRTTMRAPGRQMAAARRHTAPSSPANRSGLE